MHSKFLFALILLPLLIFGACIGEEEYSQSPNDRLRFSTDTLAFDTVITEQSTQTYTLQAFNPSNKALRIARVALREGANSFFRANVDGTFLEQGSTSNLEIAARDSLRIFVELTAPRNSRNTIETLRDELLFTLESGVQQAVVLTAVGMNFHRLPARTFTADTTLRAEQPFLITDSLVIARGATLRIEAGTKLYFHAGASLIVRGKIIAEGTTDANIVMRGDRLGNMFTNQAYDNIPAQWGGVRIAAESFGNQLNFCDIHSGTYGIRCDSAGIAQRKLTLENSVLHNVQGDALYAKMCQIVVGNCQITNAGGNCVTLFGGDNHFTHCTIGQFYAFSGGRGVALQYSNTEHNLPLPLTAANFQNCIITGYNSDDILALKSERYTNEKFDFAFRNCLLNTPKVSDNAQVVNSLFEEDAPANSQREKNFSPAFDLATLRFYFGLSENSRAIGAADHSISASTYPQDRRGKPRGASGRSDIGCYEH